jgi:SAM-dependent methyltransferase
MSTYAHGYFAEMVDLLERRTAASEAGFFTPLLKPGVSLLDCGCGPGTLTAGLAAAVAPGRVVGVDADAGQVERARAHAASLGLANVDFRVADVNELPFADGTFDVVWAHTLLQHLPDPARGLREMHRVLKSPGMLGVREEDWGGTFFYPSNAVLERGARIVVEDWQQLGGDPYLPRRYRRLLREAGFAEIRTGASAVTHSGAGAPAFAAVAANYLLAPSTKARVIEAGRSDERGLEDLRDAWRVWGRDPDAFWSFTYVEAVALKA